MTHEELVNQSRGIWLRGLVRSAMQKALSEEASGYVKSKRKEDVAMFYFAGRLFEARRKRGQAFRLYSTDPAYRGQPLTVGGVIRDLSHEQVVSTFLSHVPSRTIALDDVPQIIEAAKTWREGEEPIFKL